MVRSYVQRRDKDKEPAIAIYMPAVREYLSGFEEKGVKEAIKVAGGEINKSGLFLKVTSEATAVSSATGINRRSVAYIPRSRVTPATIQQLDRCKC